jgi:hypothetical protein
MHKYLSAVKQGSAEYDKKYVEYKEKYNIG